MSEWRDIAVVRALGGIGDVLCAVPALARLRHRLPDARITYIGMPQVAGVVERYPELVDAFVPFPGFPGVSEAGFAPAALQAFLADTASRPRFDLAIQMHGSGSVTNVFTALLGATTMAGYHVPGLWKPEGHYAPFPDALSEVDRWLDLVGLLGCTEDGMRPEFLVTDAERDAVAALLAPLNGARYAVLHPGASDPRRRWPVERFAAVGDQLAFQGLRVVLTGTQAEAEIVGAVVAAMNAPALELSARTSLGAAAASIERATLTVTNDTGTSHLAAAMRAPSIVIFIASDRARWAPADTGLHVAVGRGVPDVPIGRTAAAVEPSLPPVAAVIEAVEHVMAYA